MNKTLWKQLGVFFFCSSSAVGAAMYITSGLEDFISQIVVAAFGLMGMWTGLRAASTLEEKAEHRGL